MTLTVENIQNALLSSPYRNPKGNYFHMDPELTQIIQEATKRGYVRRISHTQAEWIEEGLEKAIKEL
jgi:hypothetical protein